VFVPRAFVCVTGSTQPDKLPELKNMSEDGLPDRFLYTFPDRVSSRDNDNEISDDAIAGYQEVFDRLVGLEMMVDENGEPYPQRVKFTEKARKRWGTEADALREEMEHPEFPRDLEGPWSKFEAYLARLSLILALVRIVEEGGHNFESLEKRVTERDVRAAGQLLAYFKAHARKVYAKIRGEKPQNLLGAALKGFLREQGAGGRV
jgi:putative DNA primase/helicase